MALLVDFRKAAHLSYHKERVSRSKVVWAPPALDYIKVNVDATVNKKSDRIGVGVVARNHAG